MRLTRRDASKRWLIVTRTDPFPLMVLAAVETSRLMLIRSPSSPA
jgi:hypothetical protein